MGLSKIDITNSMQKLKRERERKKSCICEWMKLFDRCGNYGKYISQCHTCFLTSKSLTFILLKLWSQLLLVYVQLKIVHKSIIFCWLHFSSLVYGLQWVRTKTWNCRILIIKLFVWSNLWFMTKMFIISIQNWAIKSIFLKFLKQKQA